MSAPPKTLDPAATALFLDVDGTLLDIQDHPQSVTADARLLDRLDRTRERLGHALALISGRGLADIDRIFAPLSFAAAGAHGTELRMAGGEHHDPPTPDFPGSAEAVVERFVAEHEGLLLEHKAAGLSLHYRNAPELEADARSLVHGLMDELGEEFRLIDGKKVLEIAPRAHCKGAAVRRFLEYPPFSGRRPVFVGDDVTDEDGFEAVAALDGVAIRVGALDGSRADYSLPDVASVHAWIDEAFA